MDPRTVKDLARSGLTPEDVSAEDSTLGYVIPYWLPDGTRHPAMWRERYFELQPDAAGKLRKYNQPAQVTPDPYFSKLVKWEHLHDAICIVEGEKKAASGIKHLGLNAIGIGGCGMWSIPYPEATNGRRNPHIPRLHPLIAEFLEPGMVVPILFDGDFKRKLDVGANLARLCQRLEEAGAVPRVVVLPDSKEGKVGLDDWIMANQGRNLHKLFDDLPTMNWLDLPEYPYDLEDRVPLQRGGDMNSPIFNAYNLSNILEHSRHYNRRIYFDEMAGKLCTTLNGQKEEWTDAHDIVVLNSMQSRYSPNIKKNNVLDALSVVKVKPSLRRNLLVEYLDSLPVPNEIGHLETTFPLYFGAVDNEYTRAVGAKWFIGLIARAYEPGCQNDTMLILEGAQGIGKSRALRAIGNAAGQGLYAETTAPIDSKDFMEGMRGVWVYDMAELSAMKKLSEGSALKGLLTRTKDDYRPAYGRHTESHPRRCVIVGSTNEAVYLRDHTGNRRFWPIRCGATVQLEMFTKMLPVLLAEAVARYKSGEDWYSVPEDIAREEQAARAEIDIWTEPVKEYVNKTANVRQYVSQISKMASKDTPEAADLVYRYVALHPILLSLGLETHMQDGYKAQRVVHILASLGWERARARLEPGGPQVTVYRKYEGKAGEVDMLPERPKVIDIRRNES